MADAFADTATEESGGIFKAAVSSAKVLILMLKGALAESTSCFPAIAAVFAATSAAKALVSAAAESTKVSADSVIVIRLPAEIVLTLQGRFGTDLGS